MPTNDEEVEEVAQCRACQEPATECACENGCGCRYHCGCWACAGCDRTLNIDHQQCSTCNKCEARCCRCYSCEGCEERYTHGWRVRNGWCAVCDRCPSCCNCAPEEDEDGVPEGVNNYGYKPRPIFFPGQTFKQPNEVCYGVELEVNYAGGREPQGVVRDVVLRVGDHAYLKEDSSLCSGGFEIVTHPHTYRAMVGFWKGYFGDGVPKGLSAYKTGECGMHVHMTREIIGEATIRRMVTFLNDERNLRFVEMVAQRGLARGSYARFKHEKGKPSRESNFGCDKYELLNVSGMSTVEMRIFRASYRLDRVLKNLEFCKALVEFCGTTSYAGLGYARFATWVLGRRKSYPNLVKYVEEKGGWIKGMLVENDKGEVEVCA